MDILKKVWPEWEIVKELGAGAFGKVYEIKRSDIGGEFKAALKIITIPKDQNEVAELKNEGMDDESTATYYKGLVEDLVNEFALMERLKGNTNVVTYEDHKVVPFEEGIGWNILIRMELLTPLNTYMISHQFSELDVINLGIDMCKALELCNRQNIIHRDIKPENIFISEFGDYKLGDFGIARTAEKTTMGMSKKGTYIYMAPEVYAGKPYNATVDVYSLGIVLYRLLNNNRIPFLPAAPTPITFADKEAAQVRRLQGETLPPPVNASTALYNVLTRACAFQPSDRFSTPQEMRGALEMIKNVLTPATDMPYTPVSPVISENTAEIKTEALTAAPTEMNTFAPTETGTSAMTEAGTSAPVIQQTVSPAVEEAINKGWNPIGTPNGAVPSQDATVGAYGNGTIAENHRAEKVMPTPKMPVEKEDSMFGGSGFEASTPVQRTSAPASVSTPAFPSQPQKKKKWPFFVAGGIVAVAAIIVICMIVNSNRSYTVPNNPSLYVDSNSSSEISTDNILNTDITEQMLWGWYIDENSTDGEASESFRQDMKFDVSKEVDGENYDLSVVPYYFEAGRALDFPGSNRMLTFPDPLDPDFTITADEIPTGEELDALREEIMKKRGEDGIEYYDNMIETWNKTYTVFFLAISDEKGHGAIGTGVCVMDGDTLNIREPIIDPDTYTLSYGDVKVSFDVMFDGLDLIVSGDGCKKRLSTYGRSRYNQEIMGTTTPSETGYAKDKENTYKDICGISYGYPGFQQIDFTDGSFSSEMVTDHGLEMEFNDDGTFRMKWSKRSGYTFSGVDDPTEITGNYIECHKRGCVLFIDGGVYYYNYSANDYFSTKLSDTNLLEGLSEEELDELEALLDTLNIVSGDLLDSMTSAGIDATMDENNGQITMDDGVLFGVDSDQLSDEGKEYLDRFLQAYADAIMPFVEDGTVTGVIVEGHTDPNGSYEYNMDLSERRAQSVKDYCLEVQPELAGIMTVKGCSYAYPVKDASGKVDNAASRRVVFKFVLNS